MIRLAPRRGATSREADVRARAARAGARRASRQRHARRATIAALAALAAGFAASSLAEGRVWRLVDGEARAIEAIVVTGHEQVDAQEIARESGVAPGSAIDAVDLAAVERAIEAVDWVRDATVHRAPNATLVVAIEERAAAALLLHVDSQSWFALEADGAPIAQVDPSAHATLPRLQASDALDLHVPSDDAQRALSLAGEFARRGLPPVEWIALPARRATSEADVDAGADGFRAKLAADGAVVALGDAPSANQLDRLGELLAKRPDVARDAASIDLRFRDRAILRMREPAVDDAEAASTPEGEITLNVEPASDEVGRSMRERVWMRALASSGALWIQRSRTHLGGNEEWRATTT